jgi:hypothetical protein
MAISQEARELAGNYLEAANFRSPKDPNLSDPCRDDGYTIKIDLGKVIGTQDRLVVAAHMIGSLRVFSFIDPSIGLLRTVPHGKMMFTDPLVATVQKIMEGLDGNDVEVDTSRMANGVNIAPTSYWDKWKEGMQGEIYRGELYPSVIEAVRQRVVRLPGGKLIMVDLFGGDGEFVEMAKNEFGSASDGNKYHIIDANKVSLIKARQRFVNQGVEIHDQDLTMEGDIFSEIDEKPTLVTAIGGLCSSIVTRTQAIEIARKVFEKMAPGGFFMLTGYTAMVLNSTDFSEIGFEVEQMSIPQNVLTFKIPDQFYVLKKPTVRLA